MPYDNLLPSTAACFPGEQGISILPGTGGRCDELDEPSAYRWVSCDYKAAGLMNELFFGADLLGKGAGEEADSLSPFVWEVSAIRRGFSTVCLIQELLFPGLTEELELVCNR